MKKTTYIDFLRDLTTWLTLNKREPKITLKKLCQIHKIKQTKISIIKRILSYCYNSPKLIWFFNKYYNHLYTFDKFTLDDYGKDLRFLMNRFGLNNNKKLAYIKSSEGYDPEKLKAFSVFNDYFNFIKENHLNIDELNNLYHLFQYGNDIISEDDLYKISSINKEKNIKKNNNNDINNDSKELEKKIEQYINNSKTHILPKKIRKFILDIKSSIQNNTNKSCLKCKLHGKPIVVLDTNVEDFTEIDVMFIALNPGKDEVTFDKPLVGRAGKLHRKYMYFLPKNTKWLITNIMLCFTSNQKEIGTTENQILNVAANCFQNLKMILEKFPPKIIVPIGVPAMKVFGIQGSIKSNSGQVFEKEIQNNHKIKLIPLVHPSAVIRYHGDLEIAYNNGFKTLYDILNGNLKSTKSINKKNKKNNLKYKFTLNESLKKNLITEDDLTKTDYLFDVIELDSNNILMTFISKNGDKKYMIVDYKIPIFIKTDKNYKNHKMLENPDSVVFVNGYERYKLMKTLKESLNFNKNKIKKGW